MENLASYLQPRPPTPFAILSNVGLIQPNPNTIVGSNKHFLNNSIQANLFPLFSHNFSRTKMNNLEYDPIMAIQINCFHCEGIVITLCTFHKFSDIFTLINFVNGWAAITDHHQD
ncbi:hypothetical protein Ahy_A09g042200 [Arachis hypogaea]|uniref:Uncharacterized protein n=1 Tax=Arachis hypogaea TaxID=3818 RepID=A0A445BF36_ARAHY|nr:hypothetical protein Ahy_A09g042200 [Arachis hypogaea]